MAFSHLEELISEYLEWKGFLVRKNVKVGRLLHGGWEMELDIIAYHPGENRLVQYEPSIDALSWEKREARYAKKFGAGQKYIKTEIFKWISVDCSLEQFAVFISHPPNRHEIAGGRIVSIDEFMREVKIAVMREGIMGKRAIPESFPFLRTIQLTLNGYYKNLEVKDSKGASPQRDEPLKATRSRLTVFRARKPEWASDEPKGHTVRDIAEWLIMNRPWDYKSIAEEVRRRKGSQTTAKSVAWYANKLRKAGYEVPKRSR